MLNVYQNSATGDASNGGSLTSDGGLWSFSCYAYFIDGVDQNQRLVAWGNGFSGGSSSTIFSCSTTNSGVGDLRLRAWDTTTAAVDIVLAPPPLNQWIKIYGSCDGSTMTFGVEGIDEQTANATFRMGEAGGRQFRLGEYGSPSFNHQMSHVRITASTTSGQKDLHYPMGDGSGLVLFETNSGEHGVWDDETNHAIAYPGHPLDKPRIKRFDDIPDLHCYFSGAESNIVKSGNTITTVDSVYGDSVCQLAQGSANPMLHDGTTKIGEVPCFIGDASLDTSLIGTFDSFWTSGGGVTIATLERRHVNNGSVSLCTNEPGGGSRAAIHQSSTNYACRMGGTAYSMDEPPPRYPIDSNDNCVIFGHSTDANSAFMRVNQGYYAPKAHSSQSNQEHALLSVNAYSDGSSSAHADIAIALVYSRLLTQEEAQDVMDLLMFWRDNGRAPTSDDLNLARFDDGDLNGALVAYWSAAESAINKTGNTVNSVTTVYGNEHPLSLTNPNTGTNEISHGLTTVGDAALPTFEDSGTGQLSKLKAAFTTPIDPTINGASIIVVYKRRAAGTGDHTFGLSKADQNSGETRHYRSGGINNHHIDVGNALITHDRIHTDQPTIVGAYNSHDGLQCVGRVDNDENSLDGTALTGNLTHVYALNDGSDSATASLNGHVVIILVYNRMLTKRERDDVHSLCQNWLDEGGTSTPTTGVFGPVATNKDGEVTSWQWEESADGNSWANVGTILTDISGATTNTLTVNSATVAMHNTKVRCRADTATQTANSDPASLLIEGET